MSRFILIRASLKRGGATNSNKKDLQICLSADPEKADRRLTMRYFDKFDSDWWRKRRRVSWRSSHHSIASNDVNDDGDGDVGCTRSQGQLMLLAILMMV
eukprot:scaffold2930_cov90-Skeletonema_dohrnii-CCMP3373.AAC.1